MELAADDALVAYYVKLGKSEVQARHLARLNGDKPLVRLMGETEPVLALLREGKTVPEVADHFGCNKVTLYQWLMRSCPGEWAEIAASGALSRMQDAEDEIDRSVDQVDVSRAATKIRNEQWKLERLLPKIFGGQAGGGGVQITVNLDRSCGGEVVVSGGGVSGRISSGSTEASDGTVFEPE
jgi:hypothetical protein